MGGAVASSTRGWAGDRLRARELPVALRVPCSADPTAPGTEHEVTLTADWELDTGHDLELERLGAALGGWLSCLELADRVLPAVRGLWLARTRSVPHRMVRLDHRQGSPWVLGEAVPGCYCATGGFRDVAGLVDHLSSPEHWATAHEAPIGHVERFYQALEHAAGVLTRRPARRAVLGWDLSARVREADGAERLWRLGLPPEVIATTHQEISPWGEPLPVACYRDVLLRGCPTEWLAQFAELGSDAVTWAARSWGARDRSDPGERLRWVRAGAHRLDVEELMLGTWTLDEVAGIATGIGYDLRRVTAVCASWQRVGCHPGPEDLRFLLAHEHVVPRFGRDAVLSLVARFEGHSAPPTRTEAGLVLGIAGSVRLADSLLRRGVRTLSEADAIL